jgi:hypothetical protein
MLEIYEASTINVREIKSRYKSVLRLINNSILYNRKGEVVTLTKLLALLYSAFAEVSFIKLINTPYCFNSAMIEDIQKQRSLEDKWKKCIDLGFLEIEKQSNLGMIANQKKKIYEILDEYIIKPSQIRNKIAHGQWKIALNNESTAQNNETTIIINNLDFVKIDISFLIYDKYEQLIENLIESPQKAHYKYFYTTLYELNELIERTKTWSIQSKTERILRTKNKNEDFALRLPGVQREMFK